jgi:hypothetical protein
MAAPPVQLPTSWVRVEGPSDAQSCAWCRRWVGRALPVELQAAYAEYHRAEGAKHACRCQLEPADLPLDANDPDCCWA